MGDTDHSNHHIDLDITDERQTADEKKRGRGNPAMLTLWLPVYSKHRDRSDPHRPPHSKELSPSQQAGEELPEAVPSSEFLP